MTTITLNIKDDNKTGDVLRFLRDIDFLEVSEPVVPDAIMPFGINYFKGVDLGWTPGVMNRDEMNAR